MDIAISLYHDTRRQKKDGTYPVKIRVTFKRKQRYYKSDYSFSEEDFIVVISQEILRGKITKEYKSLREARKKLDAKIVSFQEAVDILGNVFSWEMFEAQLQKNGKNVVRSGKVYEYYDNYISELEAYGKEGTAEVYRYSRDKFQEFRKSLNFDEVTPEFLRHWQSWMIRNGMSKTTISMYVRALRSLYNQAIDKGEANPLLYPFRKFKPPAQKNRKTAISLTDMKKFFEYAEPDDYWKAVSLAIFKFSYLTGGMNLTDICHLKHSDIKGDYFVYDRIKTIDTEKESEPIEVHLLDAAKEIIEKYGTGIDYVFPFIKKALSTKEKKARIKQVNKNINKWVQKVAEELEIEDHVTFYSARHSFATVLMKKGIPVAQISRMLGHADIKTTQDYLASFTREDTKKASQVLLDFD
jgi:integrase